MSSEVKVKQCIRCKDWKSVDEFSYDKYRSDGLDPRCRDCNKIRKRLGGQTIIQDPVLRFWSKVDKTGECWVWAGTKRGEYGQMSVKKKRIGAHVFSYQLAYGEIPEGLLVCHHCDNPPCVRPDHLFAGTTRDNARDMSEKGRSVKGAEQHAAKLTDEQVAIIRRRYVQEDISQRALAAEYGVKRVTVRNIVRGFTWKHIPMADEDQSPSQHKQFVKQQIKDGLGIRAKLTRQQAEEVRQRAAQGATKSTLAREYGISHKSIRLIVARKTYI